MIGFNESACFSILLSQSSRIQEANFNCLDNQFGCMIHAANLQQLTYCVLREVHAPSVQGSASACSSRGTGSAVDQRMKLFESIW
jgi:hypothetical protein